MQIAIKRLVDLVVSATTLFVASPVIILIAAAIRLLNGRPVLFRQERPGRDQRAFEVLKFRTMTTGPGQISSGSESARITRLGALLRSTSLDELPQLWNVLCGHMSVVGPRPLLTQYLPYYTDRERLRFSVRPGITGWAQLHGRNVASWDDRLELDAWYVDNWSIRLDLRILVETLLSVVRRSGVSIDPGAEMLNLDDERRRKPSSSDSGAR